MNSLIKPDDFWTLWAIIAGWAAISIYLEQTYKWAAKVSGAIIALLGALILSNLRIIPSASPIYDSVWGYIVPLALPFLLFQCNIKKIWKESGRILILFFISSFGTMAGGFIGFALLSKYIPDLPKIAGMMTGSYIGGSVNFVAIANSFEIPAEMVSAAVVADNLLMALYFFVLIALPSIALFKKNFKTPYIDEVEKNGMEEAKTLAAAYWQRKEISLKDIAFGFASSILIVAISTSLSQALQSLIPTSGVFFSILNMLLGNKYLLITTIAMLCATFAPKFFSDIRGAQEVGTFLIYLFLTVIGAPASISLIIERSPLLLVFCAIMVLINMLVTFTFARILKFSLEEAIMASNANIGGPTTAAAMAISRGWTTLVAPVLLIGTLGYVVGTYFGIFMTTILMK